MDEKKQLIRATYIPLLLLSVMWIVFLISYFFGVNFVFLGIHPRHVDGLPGIATAIFVHGDWEHIISNSIPLLLLGSALFLYYREFAFRLLIYLTLLTGFYVWLMARDSWHIGASGLVYALASFHITSALLRREMRLLAFSMLVIFLYGGMVWGFFPEFFPEKNISWESHLMGAITGIVFAFHYRKIGLQRKPYFDDEEEDEDDEDAYWKTAAENEP
jgi:membrane associated rhomboid family serine protease